MSGRRSLFGTRAVIALVAAAALSSCSHVVVLHDPLSASEHNDLGVVYETKGQLDLAAREYVKALRLEPRHSQARVNLGNVESARGRWSEAEKCYRRALRDSSTNSDAMNNLAVVLMKRNRSRDEARLWAERAVAAGGEHDSIYRATLAEVSATGR